jgi:AraC-like DNA-binding protein
MKIGIDFDNIPEGCRDQHLPMAPDFARIFGESGIRGMGIHEMSSGYEIVRRPVNWHLGLITYEGEAQWETQKESGVMKTGDLWIVSSRLAHRYTCSSNWKFISIALTEMEGFAHFEKKVTHNKFLGNLEHLKNTMEAYLFESTIMDNEKNITAEPLAHFISRVILRELQPMESYDSNRERLRMRELWEVVNANPGDHWTVPRMSDQLNVSVRQFQRMMKTHFESTAEKMLTRIRMEKAKELLIASDLPMAKVADRIGYESVYSFSKAFKRYFNTTPGALSKQMNHA